MSNHFITLNGVCKSYNAGSTTHQVLNALSLTVAKGEQIAILGHSGCGKSTLLNLISGIDNVDSGDISVADTNLTHLSEKQRTLFRRQHIGFIFQSFNLIHTLTALENIQLPLQLNRYPTAEIEARAQALLTRVGLQDRGGAYPDQLSGGEQQRVAIARAMVHSPALVLADEHTGNLDADTGREMIELFSELAQSENQTVLLVTHSLSIARTADRVLRFSDGALIADNNLDNTALAW